MTDLRNISSHNESEPSGWLDVIKSLIVTALIMALLALAIQLPVGARSIDDVLQIPASERVAK